MAANPFDVYDEQPTQAPVAAVTGSNPFDAFDPPEVQAEKAKPGIKWLPSSMGDAVSELKHVGGMAGRVATQAVTALPLMAEDFGVGARNLVGKMTGGSSNYEYPSDTARKAMDQAFGKPQGVIEKLTDALGPAVLSAGMSGASTPSVLRSLVAPTPSLGTAAGGTAGDLAQVPANFVNAKQAQAQQLANSLRGAQEAGFKVPPATTNPTVKNQLIEMAAGKIPTQQAASVANQGTANKLSSVANGLNPDAPLTADALQAVRKEAGQAYEAVRGAGAIPTDDSFLTTIANVAHQAAGPAKSFPGTKVSTLVAETDSLAVPSFEASHAVDKIAELRDAANVAYRAGDTGLGKGYKTLSQALEAQMERALQDKATKGTVSPDLVSNFQNARKTIAIAHATEDALVPGSNDVSIAALARALKRGDIPKDSPLAPIARFGTQFEKAAQSPAKIGSAGVNHLSGGLAASASLVGEHALGPWGLVTGPAYLATRGAAKSYALSGMGQRGAIPSIATPGPRTATAAALMQALKQAGP